MTANEFALTGKRLVRADGEGLGCVRWHGDTIRSTYLAPLVGSHVHIYDGCGGFVEVSAWLDVATVHPGGWKTRAGATICYIATDGSEWTQVKNLNRTLGLCT